MPASTSTITTSNIPKDAKAARLRSSPDAEAPPPLEVKEHDFFWTYTEEPHRTRRMAIIKAHPEVIPLLSPIENMEKRELTLECAGNQALRARAPHKVPRPPRRLYPSARRLQPTKHPVLVSPLLGRCIHHRRNGKPESVPCNP
jgi:Sphingolipid Delta4-desaturase (DES)